MLFKLILLAVYSSEMLLSSLNLVESLGALKFEENFDGDLVSKWNLVDRGDGFGNNELQYYRPQNARIENGNLIIESKKELYNGKQYTSAKLTSKQSFKYGYFEMRAKLPRGRGTWPAFWLLASKNPLNWPLDGEIDIMEHVGFEPGVVHGTIHCQNYNHLKGNQKAGITAVTDPFDTFHTYGLEWSENSITVFVDGTQYFQYKKEDNSYESWPFDNEFYIILNNAIGGDWGGAKGVDDTIFTTKFTIDYVRVYELDDGPVVINPSGNKITLRSKQNNKYVSAENNGNSPLVANRDQAQLWETFELIKNDDDTFSFKSLANNRFVSADNYGNSPIIANKDVINDWEKFTLIANSDGTVSFKAKVNGKFVCAEFYNDIGHLIANRDSISTWESFYLTYV